MPNKLTIQEMQKLAKEHGGICLSEKYVNSHIKLEWQCKEGHVWKSMPYNVKNGRWCQTCNIAKLADKKRGHIQQLQIMAAKRGGKCLSKKYLGSMINHHWQCKEGHIWQARPDNVLQGTWCQICSLGLSERICRAYFETIFGKKFPKVKPQWLNNAKGNKMEIDGYCRELALGFEYHGQQHYLESHFYHSTRSLDQQMLDDQQKRVLCKQQGVTLLEIPYTVPYDKMYAFIVELCRQNKIILPEHKYIPWEKLGAIYPEKLKEVQSIAKKKGGKCLSESYFNALTKLKWQCKEGHIWETTPSAITQGYWCPKCGGAEKLTIEEMQEIAKERGGQCLSKKYVNANTKLLWQCKEGHIWEAKPSDIKNNISWCHECLKLTIQMMHDIAKKHGGKCLSKVYVNAHTKLQWQCKLGHTWEARPSDIKNGGWCATCNFARLADRRRGNIQKP